MRGVAITEQCGEAAVEFAGDDVAADFEEMIGEGAGAGPDFEDEAFWGEGGGADESADVGVLDEEVLAEGSVGSQAVRREEFFDG